MKDTQILLGEASITVAEAMKKIDHSGKGILFIIDQNRVLKGCVTDGDIRRFFLGGGELNAPVLNVANLHPKIAFDYYEAKRLYNKQNHEIIPIVTESYKVIDFYANDDVEEKGIYKPLNIPVVINAGGKGTRLEPFTHVLPKPLIPVGEYPIIEHIMKEYQKYNCTEFHIIVNHKKELIKAYFHDSEDKYSITWYDEKKPLGTGGGLCFLRKKITDTFFFANCDSLLTADYSSMLDFHKENNNTLTMICVQKKINIPYGVVELDDNGMIKKMSEKPSISFLTNAGIYIVEPVVLENIKDEENIGFPEVVEREKRRGGRVSVFPVSDDDWMDMGQLSGLEKMRKKLYGE